MNYQGHIIVGLSVGIYIEHNYNINLPTLKEQSAFYSTLFISSVLPDIDRDDTFIGRRVKPLSWLINKVFGHRGALHSPLFMILVYLGIKHYTYENIISIAFLIGYSSHLIVDMFTPRGIPLFPFGRNYSFVKRKKRRN